MPEPVLAAACQAYRQSTNPAHRFFHLGELMAQCRDMMRWERLKNAPQALPQPRALAIESPRLPDSQEIPNGDFEALAALLAKNQDDVHPLAIGPRNEAEIVELNQRRAEALARAEAGTI